MPWNTETKPMRGYKRPNQYRVWFKKEINCSVLVSADSAEEAAEAFDNGDYNESTLREGDAEIVFNIYDADVELLDEGYDE